jgi:hypothetical protein
MKVSKFVSFGGLNTGRLVTAGNGYEVVQARNPHGSHNLIIVNCESGEAIRHGTSASFQFVQWAMPSRCTRKIIKHLYKKGVRFA